MILQPRFNLCISGGTRNGQLTHISACAHGAIYTFAHLFDGGDERALAFVFDGFGRCRIGEVGGDEGLMAEGGER